MPSAPISESWFAEKSSSVVEHLARAMAAARHVEDEVLRDLLLATLEAAMVQAMKTAAAGLFEPSAAPPEVAASAAKDPDAVLPWLKQVRALDTTEPHRRRPPEGIVAYVDRVLEEQRRERA